jgi:hypothetical protein
MYATYPEDGNDKFLPRAGTYRPNYVSLYPRKQQSSNSNTVANSKSSLPGCMNNLGLHSVREPNFNFLILEYKHFCKQYLVAHTEAT